VTDLDAAARSVLRDLVAPGADFRPGQLEAIEALVRDRRRVLVVQRTGWGKSAVYFIATRLLRNLGAGPTVLISPLLGLMRNQIEAATRGSVGAATINSDNQAEWDRVTEELLADQVDILLVSPERFANQKFRERVLPYIAQRAGLLVIDEAHCISDWGHDFRPDYRRIARVLDLVPRNVPVLCTTATANDRVVADIVEQLGDDLLVLRGSLERESLALDVVHLPSQAQRMAWLAQVLATVPGTGIVYTLTVADAERVAEWLQQQGIDARAYFGAEEPETKQQIEQDLQHNRLKCVVATSALGMGYDKPDLAFVVHFQAPGSAVAYYQQVGRAGRAVDRAYGIVLAGEEDARIQDWFINTAFPPREHAEAVVSLLAERGDWVRLAELEELVNLRRTRLTNMLKVLEVEGAIERNGNNSRRTLAPWTYPEARVAAVTSQRRVEQVRMHDYLHGDRCLLQMLREELDDANAAPCGRCGRCLGRPLFAVDLDTQLARDAARYLRGQWVSIEPRKRWPDGGAIPADLRAEPGRALAQYGDGGWGTMVKEQKPLGAYSDELVTALVQLVRDWAPDPNPTWVTAVPSRRHPELVPNFAARVAQQLGVPFVPAVTLTRDTAPQKEMDNSAQQYRNVRDAFVVSSAAPAGPVLLVDDIVDSRWTSTVVAAALRETGVDAVFPVVLAVAQSD
jgi:ATP-dependent DNA helicase RecQ